MQESIKRFEQRKKDHIQLALQQDNQSIECHYLDSVSLIHEALPDLNFDEISLKSIRLGRTVEKPFIVSSMTAGHAQAPIINRHLLSACAEKGWAMGVGSQRREIHDPQAEKEWSALCKDFPNLALYSNLGIAQLITSSIDDVKRLRDSIHAQAFIIHLNALQECIQPEGTPQFKGAWQALEKLITEIEVPVILKETGCGFSSETLSRINQLGVAAVELSGLGGTHWGRIEGHRAEADDIRKQTAITFKNWGIDTLSAMLNAKKQVLNYEIWGSGGIRHGLDAAKLLALGARNIGFAKIMLEAALESAEDVIHLMDRLEYELKTALFCTGSRCLEELKGKIAL